MVDSTVQNKHLKLGTAKTLKQLTASLPELYTGPSNASRHLRWGFIYLIKVFQTNPRCSKFVHRINHIGMPMSHWTNLKAQAVSWFTKKTNRMWDHLLHSNHSSKVPPLETSAHLLSLSLALIQDIWNLILFWWWTTLIIWLDMMRLTEVLFRGLITIALLTLLKDLSAGKWKV